MVTLTKPKRKATNQEIMQHSLLHKGKIQLNVSLRIRDYSVSVLAGWTGSSSIIKYVYSIPEALTFEKELRKLCEGK